MPQSALKTKCLSNLLICRPLDSRIFRFTNHLDTCRISRNFCRTNLWFHENEFEKMSLLDVTPCTALLGSENRSGRQSKLLNDPIRSKIERVQRSKEFYENHRALQPKVALFARRSRVSIWSNQIERIQRFVNDFWASWAGRFSRRRSSHTIRMIWSLHMTRMIITLDWRALGALNGRILVGDSRNLRNCAGERW